jgi:hypothetical protein
MVNERPQVKTRMKSNMREDTWIDVALDFLRDHRMPAFLEVLGSWSIALFRLVHYGHGYACTHLQQLQCARGTTAARKRIPLMTHARTLKHVDETASTLHEKVVTKLKELSPIKDSSSASSSPWTPNQLVSLIRSDDSLRRFVSKFMMTPGAETEHTNLYRQLDEIWSQLLPFPLSLPLPAAVDNDVGGNISWKHSLVLPAYRERGQSIVYNLQCALESCRDPANIQVVVVDAGYCTNLDEVEKMQACNGSNSISNGSSNHQWGQVKLVHTSGGGRGPTLNYGADCTNGTILTFLHSDVILPMHWDVKIQATLSVPVPTPGNIHTQPSPLVHACAFSFGTNLSEQGLEGMGYPWGIQAVHFTVGLRTSRLKLPYGDNVISIPTAYFRYIGGFPNQPIMEDYSLMDLLRTRAKVLPETLVIIPQSTVRKTRYYMLRHGMILCITIVEIVCSDPCRNSSSFCTQALCSARRWQKFGVVYTSLTNALLVHRYASCGWTADEIFDYYYRRPFKKQE